MAQRKPLCLINFCSLWLWTCYTLAKLSVLRWGKGGKTRDMEGNSRHFTDPICHFIINPHSGNVIYYFVSLEFAVGCQQNRCSTVIFPSAVATWFGASDLFHPALLDPYGNSFTACVKNDSDCSYCLDVSRQVCSQSWWGCYFCSRRTNISEQHRYCAAFQ